jgi:tRNA/rRNA methyltransferase
VEPQLGENIGAAARAMLNCGLRDLRLVRPRDGWPSESAAAAASGADLVLERARLYESTAEAVADLQHVYAATARGRDMNMRVVTARRAAEDMRRFGRRAETSGVLFGPERSGLANDDVVLADALLIAALNPAFRSLNLAQAVLIVAYEWFVAEDRAPEEHVVKGGARPATKEELLNFFDHLESPQHPQHVPARGPHGSRGARAPRDRHRAFGAEAQIGSHGARTVAGGAGRRAAKSV